MHRAHLYSTQLSSHFLAEMWGSLEDAIFLPQFTQPNTLGGISGHTLRQAGSTPIFAATFPGDVHIHDGTLCLSASHRPLVSSMKHRRSVMVAHTGAGLHVHAPVQAHNNGLCAALKRIRAVSSSSGRSGRISHLRRPRTIQKGKLYPHASTTSTEMIFVPPRITLHPHPVQDVRFRKGDRSATQLVQKHLSWSFKSHVLCQLQVQSVQQR
jgi:hypothetical protein